MSGNKFFLVTTVPRLLFWALLTPLLISSSGIVCTPRTGDTRLSSLEIDVEGENRIAFDPALRVYDVGISTGVTTATLRAQAMDAEARLTWYVPDGIGMLASGIIGVGGGEVTVDLPPDGFSLYVGVFPPGGAVNTYIMTFAPCSSNCSDGKDCTADVCNPANGACSNPDEVDGVACDFFSGVPGICASGTCEDATLCAGVDCSDGQECTTDICDPADGSCSNPNEVDGAACDFGGLLSMCTAGVCEAPPFILAGSGSTTWSAPTSPPGGGTAPTTGGCSAFVPLLNATLYFDVVIQLDVVSDGATNITTAWAVSFANPILGVFGSSFELGSLDINAVATNATGGPINSGLTAAAAGQWVGNFIVGPLELSTPGEITPGAATLTPTAAGVGSAVNVNWDGAFSLELPLEGSPFITLDESNCDFSVTGTGVDFPVECKSDLDCEDPATACQVAPLGACNLGTGRCAAEVPGNDGASCDSGGGPGSGACDGAGACTPVCGMDTRLLTVGCTNSVTSAQSVFPTLLQVTVAEPVFSGAPFTATFDGMGAVPESFLDFAQGIVPGGVASAILEGLAATVVPINATGTPVELNVDPAAVVPGPTSFCTFPSTTVCTVDGDCGVPPCLPPVLVVDVPISTDCSPGGVCDTLGKNASQCVPNGFCVSEDLFVPLVADSGTFTAGASGEVLFGWATDVPGESDCPGTDPRCASNGGTIPDNSIALPLAADADPIPPIGIRISVNDALSVPFQCSMGANGGTCVAGGANAGLGCLTDAECPASTCDLTVDDVIVDIDPADLFACPIN